MCGSWNIASCNARHQREMQQGQYDELQTLIKKNRELECKCKKLKRKVTRLSKNKK